MSCKHLSLQPRTFSLSETRAYISEDVAKLIIISKDDLEVLVLLSLSPEHQELGL